MSVDAKLIMPANYNRVWTTMNDLEMVTSKICSAREIIDNAIDKIQEHQNDKAELLMTAAYEFLEYYLQEFDDKFKLAWQATVGDLRDGDREAPLSCDKDDPSPECKGAWNSFWEEPQQYAEEELNAMCDKAELDNKHFQEPFTTDIGIVSQNRVTHTEYLKAKIEANSAWNDGWTQQHYQKIVDKYEGKKTLNHDEAIAAGWSLTDDGFWMPPQS